MPPTGRTCAFLQHAQQLGLQWQADLADLVEEERAAVGLREQTRRHRCTAPVKAPRTWPKSSLSSSVSGSAAQSTATNGALAARAVAWMARATSSLPVPLSPRTSTVLSPGATRAMVV